jgi:hypothetical protein
VPQTGGLKVYQKYKKIRHTCDESYKSNDEWLINPPSEALIFKNLENTWKELKIVYNGDFRNLVYGDLPGSNQLVKTKRRY